MSGNFEGISPELYKAIVAIVDDRVKEIKVTREDFNELKNAVMELAQAQKKTAQLLAELTQVQKQTDQKMAEMAETHKQMEQRMAELSQAQKQTEQRMAELSQAQKQTEQRMAELSQAQKQTEQRMAELSQAQKQTEQRMAEGFKQTDQRMAELADAQKKTEKTLTNLAQEVGRLSRTIGFGLEDIAHVVLPGYLQRHFSIQMGEFERHFFPVGGKMSLEVNLYAEGKQNGQQLTVLGEAKSRIHAREVSRFQKAVEKVAQQLPYPPFKVMFAYIIYPDAMEEAKRHGITLVASYQR